MKAFARACCTAAVLAGLCGPATAIGAPAPSADDAGRKMIDQLITDAKRDLAGLPASAGQRAAKLGQLIDDYSTITLLAEDILGRFWSSASPADRDVFVGLLRDYILASYDNRLADLPPSLRIEVTTTEQGADGRLTIHSLAIIPNDMLPVDWMIRQDPAGRWVIADVTVEGVSIIQTMAGDFRAILRSRGGRLEGLFDALRRKLADYRAE